MTAEAHQYKTVKLILPKFRAKMITKNLGSMYKMKREEICSNLSTRSLEESDPLVKMKIKAT